MVACEALERLPCKQALPDGAPLRRRSYSNSRLRNICGCLRTVGTVALQTGVAPPLRAYQTGVCALYNRCTSLLVRCCPNKQALPEPLRARWLVVSLQTTSRRRCATLLFVGLQHFALHRCKQPPKRCIFGVYNRVRIVNSRPNVVYLAYTTVYEL